MSSKTTFRTFLGSETQQVNGVNGAKAEPSMWYFEPTDYEGDVLWSRPFATKALAEDACDELDPSRLPVLLVCGE